MPAFRRPVALAVLTVVVLSALLASADSAQAAGNSITAPDTAGNVGGYTSLALDASGNPVVSYYDRTNGDLKVLHCNDANCIGGGESIKSPDTVGNVGEVTSLELDAAGNPVVSYIGSGLEVLHCNDASCSGGDESITTFFPGDTFNDTSLVLDATGNPVVSSSGSVFHCNDANCSGGDESITSPDTSANNEGDSSLALDASGNPVVSYYDSDPNRDLKVLHCNDANCSGGDESLTTPDTTGDVGSSGSLALDASGNPVVSYWDVTHGDLKVLHCNDANCAGGDESISAPDTIGGVGANTSLALDAGGNPVVSYFDVSNQDLKVIHCNDANCAGGDESITAPDTAGLVGLYASLVLDGSGNPVVSYCALVAGSCDDLKLLHCGDPTCKAAAPPTPTPTPTPPPVGGISIDPPASSGDGFDGRFFLALLGIVATVTVAAGALSLTAMRREA